jgi:hypothetical protein
MKANQKLFIFFLLLLPMFVKAETQEIPFTLDDRDRIVRTEQNVESLKTEMNSRFESVDKQFNSLHTEMSTRFESIDKRFDQLFNFFYAIIGIFTVMTASVFGFAFWDRKTSLEPIKNDNLKTLNVLRELAEHQPKLREILKNAGLL